MENEWVSGLIDEGVGLSFPTEFARALRLFSGLCSVGALRVWWQALASRRDEDFRMRILSDSAVRSSLAVPVPLVGYMDSLWLGHGFHTSFSSWPSRSDGVQVMEVERGPSLALPVSSPYGSTFSGPVELTAEDLPLLSQVCLLALPLLRSRMVFVWLFRGSSSQSTRSIHGTLGVLLTSFQALLASMQCLHML